MWITNVTQNKSAYDIECYLNLVSYKQWDDYKRKANLVGIVLWNHVGMYYCNYS